MNYQPNRKDRRAFKKLVRERRLGKRNYGPATAPEGFQVTDRAFNVAREIFGPEHLSEQHELAIMDMAGRMTHLVTGWAHRNFGKAPEAPCRLARGLQCGGGKTLTAKSWMAAVHDTSAGWSVAFAANEVEALCRVKRDLTETFKVPEEKVGLLHTYKYDPTKAAAGVDGYASLPATPEDELASKQFLMVTHNMVRTGEKNLVRYNVYNGKPRDLVIYDESLLVADAASVRSWHVRQAASWLDNFLEEHPEERWQHLEPVARYIRRCREQITNGTAKVVRLPELSSYGAGLQPDSATAMLPSGAPRTLAILLQNTTRDLRLMHEANQSTGWFELKVPEELTKVMVLDASHAIRLLPKLGSNIQEDDKAVRPVVSYQGTTIEHFIHRSGRTAIEEECSKAVSRRPLATRLADWIKSRPDNEKVLVWTFKARNAGRPNVPEDLAKALEYHGVDLERVQIETHGKAQGSNEYRWARWCACYGVWEPQPGNTGAQMLGELNDLKADLTALEEVKASEIIHVLYQELSRCCVRNIDQGRAQPAGFWLPSYQPDKIIKPLAGEDIFSGARLVPREDLDDKTLLKAERERVEAAVRDQVAEAILEVLSGLPDDMDKISSVKLKPLVNDACGFEVAETTFTKARRARPVADLTAAGWELTQRGFKRIEINW